MPNVSFWQARLACMIFFAAPGLGYGLFTSRVPALTAQTDTAPDAFGLVLLLVGAAGTAGLSLASGFIRRFGARAVLVFGCLLCFVAVSGCALSHRTLTLGVCATLFGFGMGIADVAMNVQGVEIERQFSRASMSILHAGYNIGAVTGSVCGAVFAATTLPVIVNFALPFMLFSCALLWATPRLLKPKMHVLPANPSGTHTLSEKSAKTPWSVLAWVVGCGILAMISYVAEGTVGEWGSLFVHQELGAPEAVAALVYGTYSVCCLCCRLFADALRTRLGDYRVMCLGSLIACSGMTMVLTAPAWPVCLAGYAAMGIGLAPVVPVTFSFAGRLKGIAVEKATSIIATCAYTGLLLFPPVFGFLAKSAGLTASLSIVVGLLAAVFAGALLLRKTEPECRKS